MTDPIQEFMRAALQGMMQENAANRSREGAIVATKIEEAMLWRAQQKRVEAIMARAREEQKAGQPPAS